MAKRFDAYRMKDGTTPLSEAFFNPVFGELDSRIADLEERRADLQAVMQEISKFGLQRIDVLTTSAMAEMNALLIELRDVREELTAGTQLKAAMQTEAQARTEAVQGLALALAEFAAANAVAFEQEGLAREDAIAQATATPSAATFGYDAAGRVLSITETLPQGQRVNTITYGADGRVQSITKEFAGATHTTTFSYDAQGAVTGYTVTED